MAAPDQEHQMSFRQISNAGRCINIGKFPSDKMSVNIWTESILERDLIHRLEHDSNVISYRTQAVRIFFELDGTRRHYTADVLCERRIGRPQIIEVKPKKKLSPWFLQVYRIITLICEREGFEFVVYTEFEIRIQPFLDNIKCLWKYARTPLYPSHQILCYEFFSSRQEVPLGKLFEFFVMRQVERQVVLALLYHKILSTDLSIPLGPDSPVRYQSGSDAGSKEAS
jgi:hypothetical protein